MYIYVRRYTKSNSNIHLIPHSHSLLPFLHPYLLPSLSHSYFYSRSLPLPLCAHTHRLKLILSLSQLLKIPPALPPPHNYSYEKLKRGSEGENNIYDSLGDDSHVYAVNVS